jgi:hypothetical protein
LPPRRRIIECPRQIRLAVAFSVKSVVRRLNQKNAVHACLVRRLIYAGRSVDNAARVCCTNSVVGALMLHVSRRPFPASPRSGFVPHAQAPAPLNIYGQQLELVENTSPRELPCYCQIKPVSLPRHAEGSCLLYLSTMLSLPLSLFTSLLMCAGAAPFLFVLEEHVCSLG